MKPYAVTSCKTVALSPLSDYPSGMFSDNAGTDVGSDLIVLQKQTSKEISKGIEQQFVETVSVPKEEGSSAFIVRASEDIAYKDVISILDNLKMSGARFVSVATERK